MQQGRMYLALIVLLFVSCEDYYKPDLEVIPELLVVESHLTNDPGQNFVKLGMTRNFYSTEPVEKIIGARVDLIEVGGQTILAAESGTGYFTFAKTPVPGKKYILRIVYKKNTYESEAVIMPPLPTIDSLYTTHKIEKSFRTNAYGVPDQIETPVRVICIDAPITKLLQHYRFSWRTILQWSYFPQSIGPPPPPYFGWISRYDNGLFNISGPKEFSVSNQVKNHPILSLAYNSKSYLDSAEQLAMGWILILHQYGISRESNAFHEKLNKQLSAEGSLFDPVLTQVYGNMHCKNDRSKIILGFFDLNSYRQYRYFLNLGSSEKSKVIQRRLNRQPEIPDVGFVRGIPPEFWENNY